MATIKRSNVELAFIALHHALIENDFDAIRSAKEDVMVLLRAEIAESRADAELVVTLKEDLADKKLTKVLKEDVELSSEKVAELASRKGYGEYRSANGSYTLLIDLEDCHKVSNALPYMVTDMVKYLVNADYIRHQIEIIPRHNFAEDLRLREFVGLKNHDRNVGTVIYLACKEIAEK
jgi:hypothetical protein